jgi:hypothetical protein
VATRFRDNHSVLFHTYDEPNGITGECLRDGCTVEADGSGGGPAYGRYQAAGQQALVDAIRSTGARQPIAISGIEFAGRPDLWEQFMPNDPHHALVLNISDFDYSPTVDPYKSVLRGLAAKYPVLIGGFGDTDCNSDHSDSVMSFADRAGISYLAWTWNTEADYGGCKNALLGPLSAYYSGKPSGFGRGIRRHFRSVGAG